MEKFYEAFKYIAVMTISKSNRELLTFADIFGLISNDCILILPAGTGQDGFHNAGDVVPIISYDLCSLPA